MKWQKHTVNDVRVHCTRCAATPAPKKWALQKTVAVSCGNLGILSRIAVDALASPFLDLKCVSQPCSRRSVEHSGWSRRSLQCTHTGKLFYALQISQQLQIIHRIFLLGINSVNVAWHQELEAKATPLSRSKFTLFGISITDCVHFFVIHTKCANKQRQ